MVALNYGNFNVQNSRTDYHFPRTPSISQDSRIYRQRELFPQESPPREFRSYRPSASYAREDTSDSARPMYPRFTQSKLGYHDTGGSGSSLGSASSTIVAI